MRKQLVYTMLLLGLLAGCGSGPEQKENTETPFVDETVLGAVESEQNILAQEPALPDILEPEASGTAVEENEKAIIDYSNIAELDTNLID